MIDEIRELITLNDDLTHIRRARRELEDMPFPNKLSEDQRLRLDRAYGIMNRVYYELYKTREDLIKRIQGDGE